MSKILLLHGPNLNLLGTREPEHYGSATLDSINAECRALAEEHGVELECLQSNAEHVLVDKIQQSTNIDFILINSAAFTHTSIAIRDALSAVSIPFIEIHLSNVHAREAFREHSYFSDIAVGVISGLGAQGYELALQAAISQLSRNN
jgi:3-dehydroquinate dehydratase-2